MKRVASLDSKKSGFTLLELLIVLAILIVIIGILGTTVWNSYKRALIRAAEVKIKTLTQAVEEFHMDQRGYPTMVEGLYILADIANPDAAAAMQQMQMQQQTMGTAGQNMNGMNGQMNTGMMNDPMAMGGNMNMNDPMAMGGNMNMNDPTMMGGNMNMNDPSMMNGQMNTGMANGQMNNMTGMQQTATVNATPKRKIPEPYIKETDLEDPWNNPFKYEWPTTKGDGKKPAIWSMGPDGEDNNGDGDDIINWDATDMSGQMNAQRNAQAAGLQNGMMQQNGMNNGMMQQGGMMDPNMGGMQQGGMMDPNMGGMQQGGMMDPNMGGMQQGGMMDPNMGGMQQGGMMDPNMGGMQQGGMMDPNMGGMQQGGQQPMF